MKARFVLRLVLMLSVALVAPASSLAEQPDPIAEHKAKAEQLCHDLQQQAEAIAAKAQQITDPAQRTKAMQDAQVLKDLIANTETKIKEGPEKLGLGPREYTDRLMSLVRAANWQIANIRQYDFHEKPSIAASVKLSDDDAFTEKVSRGFDKSRVNFTPASGDNPPVN